METIGQFTARYIIEDLTVALKNVVKVRAPEFRAELAIAEGRIESALKMFSVFAVASVQVDPIPAPEAKEAA